MISPLVIILSLLIYMAVLLVLAGWAARKDAGGSRLVKNPFVYSLGLTVLYTSWTFYGSIGKAATDGMFFIATYIGTMMPLIFWPLIVKRMIRIKSEFRITSIADFISARYDKSHGIAALVTVMALIGVMPYMALQLKAVFSSLEVIGGNGPGAAVFTQHNIEWAIVLFMVFFTIVFGARRLDPTEQHPGMVFTLAIGGIIKLVIFLIAGIVILYLMNNGIIDTLGRISRTHQSGFMLIDPQRHHFSLWASQILISIFAVMLLPRQFHMMVVENSDEKHVHTAMWLLPLYMMLITLFSLPIAAAGLLQELPKEWGDVFLLKLPHMHDKPWLTLTVFLGGFTASITMVMITALTLSIMTVNHILLPLISRLAPLAFLRRYLLQCRWAVIALSLVAAHWFEQTIGNSYMLINMGIISFAAAAQFGPSFVGGMLWSRGNRTGALLGLSAGFFLWFYTLLLPSFMKSGWLDTSLIREGLFGIEALRPESLFGFLPGHSLANSVFWSLAVNTMLYIIGSLWSTPTETERDLAEHFTSDEDPLRSMADLKDKGETLDLAPRLDKITSMLAPYFSPESTGRMIEELLVETGLSGQEHLSLLQLAELREAVEKRLSGAVGSATARSIVSRSQIISPGENEHIHRIFSDMLTELDLSPLEIQRKVNYHLEREKLLSQQALELEDRVREREREIRERASIEEALAMEKEKLAVTLGSLSEGVIATDGKGQILLMNRAARRLTGEDSEDLRGITLGETLRLLDEKSGAPLSMESADLINESYETNQMGKTALLLSRSGERRHITYTVSPILGSAGKATGTVIAFRDITDEKKMEEELTRTRNMESIGILAGGIAHDFNNILTAVIGNISLARIKLPEENEVQGILADAEEISFRAKDLTQQLLTFSKGGAPILKPSSIAELLEKTVSFCLRGTSIKSRFSIAGDLWTVEIDEGQISQVINNIVINAVQAMPGGGILEVSAKNVFIEKNMKTFARGPYVLFSIKDQGEGIPLARLEKIFDPYFTTKSKGSGLGLTTSHSIIKKHGGHILVDSILGSGTVFHVYLPATKKSSAPFHQEEQTQPTEGGKRILLMDDEEIIRSSISQMLLLSGFAVDTARDGNDALDLYNRARGKDQPYDLIIMDLTIPGGMGGRETIRIIRESDPSVQVIASSGYSEDTTSADFKKYGFNAFVPKPYKIDVLIEEIVRLTQKTS